jgi:feruloyl-CoA synthase
MAEPLSADGNEITDKGYVNQRAVLERRSDLVELLYTSDPEVIVLRKSELHDSVALSAASLPHLTG